MPRISSFFAAYSRIGGPQPLRSHRHWHNYNGFSSLFSWFSSSPIVVSSKISSKEFCQQSINGVHLFIHAVLYSVWSLLIYQKCAFFLLSLNIVRFHSSEALDNNLNHRAKNVHPSLIGSTHRRFAFWVWEKNTSKVQVYGYILWAWYRLFYRIRFLWCLGWNLSHIIVTRWRAAAR